MKVLLLTLLSFASIAKADLVSAIRIDKLDCTGAPAHENKAVAESQYVEISYDRGLNSGKIVFKTAKSGQVIASNPVSISESNTAGTEGGPAYVQFNLNDEVFATLQDKKAAPLLQNGLFAQKSTEIEIAGDISFSSANGQDVEARTYYDVVCKMTFTSLPPKPFPFPISPKN